MTNHIDRRKRSSSEFVYNDRPSKAIEDKFLEFFGPPKPLSKKTPSRKDTKQPYSNDEVSEISDLNNDELFFKQFTPKKFQNNKKLQDDVEVFDQATFDVSDDESIRTPGTVEKPKKKTPKIKRKNYKSRKNQTDAQQDYNVLREIIIPKKVDKVEDEIKESIEQAVKNLQIFNNEFTQNFEDFANNPKWRKSSSLRHEGDESDEEGDDDEMSVDDDEDERNDEYDEEENNSPSTTTKSPKNNRSRNKTSANIIGESVNIDASEDLINEFNERINKRKLRLKPISTQSRS